MEKLKRILEQVKNTSAVDAISIHIPALVNDNEIYRIKQIILPNIKDIENEIDLLFFQKIKHCKTVEEANVYFNILQEIQELLAILYFKESINFSEKIEGFIRDCDRLDDEWLRNKLFCEIKKDNYNYDLL